MPGFDVGNPVWIYSSDFGWKEGVVVSTFVDRVRACIVRFDGTDKVVNSADLYHRPEGKDKLIERLCNQAVFLEDKALEIEEAS